MVHINSESHGMTNVEQQDLEVEMKYELYSAVAPSSFAIRYSKSDIGN
jgi:hypothetical protein